MTSWMRAWFFIVLRAFMILQMQNCKREHEVGGDNATHRTIVAWITYFLSSSTAFKTSFDSCLTSALIGWFRLTRIFFDLKSTTKSAITSPSHDWPTHSGSNRTAPPRH